MLHYSRKGLEGGEGEAGTIAGATTTPAMSY